MLILWQFIPRVPITYLDHVSTLHPQKHLSFVRTGVSLNLELITWLGWLANELFSTLPPTPSAMPWLQIVLSNPAFYVSAGDAFQDLLLAQHGADCLSHLPSPTPLQPTQPHHTHTFFWDSFTLYLKPAWNSLYMPQEASNIRQSSYLNLPGAGIIKHKRNAQFNFQYS